MIKKLLRYFGFIHTSELTENFLCHEIAKIVGDPTEYSIDKGQEDKLFTSLSGVDGLAEYLKATMAKDIQRDFGSTQEQRALIHGAFARTSYFMSRLVKSNENSNRVVPRPKVKLGGNRYGV